MYKVIKEIGKGSFSSVYLCERTIPHILLQSSSNLLDDLFIIKQIDLNLLVKRYVGREKFNSLNIKIKPSLLNKSTIPFTPPRDGFAFTVKDLNKSTKYYRDKLLSLIESEIALLKMFNTGSEICENIITFYNWETIDDIYKIHIEYCEGGDVYSYLKDGDTALESRNKWGGFSKKFLYDFIKNVSNGLEYIHNHNLIHRDIKLQNILIKYRINGINSHDKTQVVFKISDFGFACYDMSKISIDTYDKKDYLMSKYYKLCGTPYYMAPELIKISITNVVKDNYTYSSAIDMWSFGISIYQLLFNRLPFIANSTEDLYNIYMFKNFDNQFDKKCDVLLDTKIKNILFSTICINEQLRINASECKRLSNELSLFNNHWGGEIFNIDKNNKTTITDEINTDDWEKINNHDSVLLERGVDKKFLDWLDLVE